MSALAGSLTSTTTGAQSLPVRKVSEDYKEDLFYREDWLGEPWRTPEPVVLIQGNDESSVEWYAWVPRMAHEYRLIRICLDLDIRAFRAAFSIRWRASPRSSRA